MVSKVVCVAAKTSCKLFDNDDMETKALRRQAAAGMSSTLTRNDIARCDISKILYMMLMRLGTLTCHDDGLTCTSL